MSNVHAKEKFLTDFETEFLSKTFRNPWIEKGSDDYENIFYFTKMDGSDAMTRLDGRKINRTLHRKKCITAQFSVQANKKCGVFLSIPPE